MTYNQFFQLADRAAAMSAAAQACARALARGDDAAAESAAGGRGTDDWWAAEFIAKALADHGATPPPKFSPAVRGPRTMSLFGGEA